jgi:cell division protein FtsI (penicillin-binding protein 3)
LTLKKNNINHYEMKKQFIRKEIVDSNGNILAVNLPSASLFANPYNIIDANLTLKSLSKILKNLDTKKLLKELNSNKNFVWIKHNLTPVERQQVNDLGLPGLSFEEQTKRFYIYGNLFSHAIGFVSRDNLGLGGIEKYLDKTLIIDEKNTDNAPLELTLDLRAQNIASEELESAIKKFGALGGVAIIADATNGHIIASVSKPDFNPHDVTSASLEQIFNQASL